jgi:4-hydroxybenzoate polyprenyltransferase
MIKRRMHTDIRKLDMIEKLPERYRPFAYLARLDRPVGVWLLLLPGLWAIALATGALSLKLWLAVLFAIGAVAMRSAGCVINDIWDRDLDSRVERTRGRPLAAGDVSIKQAAIFLLCLLVIGLCVLLALNSATIILGFAALPLIVLYPAMKRITYWPQAFLGLTFNFSALMGWTAVTGAIGSPALFLYLAGIFWTLGYDTIYAHQDKEDDVLIGVKSTALKFGARSRLWVGGFFSASILCLAVALFMAAPLYCAAFLIMPAAHFVWQIKNWDMDDPQSGLNMFKANRDAGLLVLLVCVLSGVFSTLF